MNWKQLLVIIIRLAVPLTIFIEPTVGITLAIIADTLDVIIWDNLHVEVPFDYHRLDKLLDNWMLLMAAIVSSKYIPVPYLYFAYFLFVLRIVMTSVFIITGKSEHRRLLLIGPNWFQWYFCVFAVMASLGNYGLLENNTAFTIVIAIVFALGYIPEIVLHYKQFKMHAFVKNFVKKNLG